MDIALFFMFLTEIVVTLEPLVRFKKFQCLLVPFFKHYQLLSPVAVFYGALAPAGGKTSSMVKHTSKSLTNETAKKQGSESKASKKNLNYSSKWNSTTNSKRNLPVKDSSSTTSMSDLGARAKREYKLLGNGKVSICGFIAKMDCGKHICYKSLWV